MKGFEVYFTALIASTVADLCLCAPLGPATAAECRRVPRKQEYIGLDYLMKLVYIDTGSCLRVSVNGSSTCPDAPCVPTTTDYVTFNLLNEDPPQNYLVKRECGLDLSECSGCKREPNFVRFFAGTPHEQVVDTGRCGGQCKQQDLSCKATAKKTKAVSGPNGDMTVEVIDKCSCKGSCYRMSYWESYFERTMDVRGHVKDVERLVDVGRCSGSCPDEAHCIYGRSGICLSIAMSCGPERQSLIKKQFFDRKGNIQSLAIIGKCNCQR